MAFAELCGGGFDEELTSQLAQPSPHRVSGGRGPDHKAATEETLSLGGYWRILRRRRWYAISFLIVVVTLVTVGSFYLTPKYVATSRISIHPEDNNVADFKDVTPTTPNNWDYELELDAQAKILQSDTLALRTIEALSLDLDQKGHFLRGVRPQGEGDPSPPLQLDPTHEAKLLSLFRRGLTISKVAHSPVIQIQYSSTDPRLSTDIV